MSSICIYSGFSPAHSAEAEYINILPNHHPTKMDVLPKICVQIILAAKWLVQHSSTFPNHSDDLCLLFCPNHQPGGDEERMCTVQWTWISL